jgi:hypothetical protein
LYTIRRTRELSHAKDTTLQQNLFKMEHGSQGNLSTLEKFPSPRRQSKKQRKLHLIEGKSYVKKGKFRPNVK